MFIQVQYQLQLVTFIHVTLTFKYQHFSSHSYIVLVTPTHNLVTFIKAGAHVLPLL
jgi:hypothetical protein